MLYHQIGIVEQIMPEKHRIFLALSSEDIQTSEAKLEMAKTCPHCGKNID
jgi:hypothetical protein